MPTVEEQLSLREKLHALEDDLVQSGIGNILVHARSGVFTWTLKEARDSTPVAMDVPVLQMVEDMIIVTAAVAANKKLFLCGLCSDLSP